MWTMRAAFLSCLATLFVPASFQAHGMPRAMPPADNIHVLALRVDLDGEEILSPNVHLQAGKTAYVTTGTAGTVSYTLQLYAHPVETGAKDGAAQVHAVLWKGDADSGAPLIDATILLEPRQASDGGQRDQETDVSVSSNQMGTGLVRIRVLSHAMLSNAALVDRADGDCVASEALASAQSIAPRGKGCCTRQCKNGKRQITCCGAIRCCACDVCCSPK